MAVIWISHDSVFFTWLSKVSANEKGYSKGNALNESELNKERIDHVMPVQYEM